MHTIHEGFCFDLHKAKPLHVDCLGTFVNLTKGVISIFMSSYILNKMNKNHRRALAGYTRNTINIDVHMSMMLFVGIWSICWGVYMMFDVTNVGDEINSLKRGSQGKKLSSLGFSMCYAITSYAECILLLLLCSTSIGKNNFARSYGYGSIWAAITFLVIVILAFEDPGVETYYWFSGNIAKFLLVRDILTVLMNIAAILYYRYYMNDRNSILRFSSYMIVMYTGFCINRGLTMVGSVTAVNAGICLMDLHEIIHFCSFGPLVYLTLKRDCQYWSNDAVDADEESALVMTQTNQMTWSELPNYKDVVIPKTELYYRKKLEERVDVSVEIHLWRRKLVILKRFRFDLLTRDNIKFFKKEANIFMTLSHQNIVTFYGVVVDPPSLGIVMQYCSKGDLFKELERCRLQAAEDKGVDPVDVKDNPDDDADLISEFASRAAISRQSLMITEMHLIKSLADFGGENPTTLTNPLLNEEAKQNPENTSIDDVPPTRKSSWSTLVRNISQRNSILGDANAASANSQPTFDPLLCALQVARGMSYLHSQGITHRDLKSMNVLLDDMYDAKIADFGESALEKTAPTQFEDDTGTAGWAAPEVITGKGSSRASDVFSYGIILWELLTWRCPSVLITVAMLKEPSIANLSGASNHTLLKFFRSGGAGINSRKPFQSTNPLQPAINSNKAKPLTIMGLNYNFFSSGNTSTTTSTSNTTDRKPQKDDSNMMFRHSDEVIVRKRSKSLVSDNNLLLTSEDDFRSDSLNSTSIKLQNRRSVHRSNSGDQLSEMVSTSKPPKFTAALSDANTNTTRVVKQENQSIVPKISDDDMTMIEISDMGLAIELMCVRKLRPPMPVGIPSYLALLLTRCWSEFEAERPSFVEIISDLEKVISNNSQRKTFSIPCEVEFVINYADSATRTSRTTSNNSSSVVSENYFI